MGYYLRVLGKYNRLVPVSDFKQFLEQNDINVNLKVTGDENDWDQILVEYRNGKSIFLIERDPVEHNSPGQEEIDEFFEEIEGEKPESAVKWLKAYLPQVTVIYAIEVLCGMGDENGWKVIRACQGLIWNTTKGILQADYEVFSNEDGFHILWQFSDDADGPWQMAIRNWFGGWTKFQMDLGNPEQRAAFLRGSVPRGVSKISL